MKNAQDIAKEFNKFFISVELKFMKNIPKAEKKHFDSSQ